MRILVVLALALSFFTLTNAKAQWGALVRTTAAPSVKVDSPNTLYPVLTFPTKETDDKTLQQLHSLVKESGWYSSLQIKVRDGIIVLEGSIKSREHLNVLLEAAHRLPTTVAVVNKVEVQPPLADNIEPVIAQMREIVARAWQLLPVLLISLCVIAIFVFGDKYLSNGLRALWRFRFPNPFLLALVTRLTLVPIWLLMFYFALRIVGVPNIGATILGGAGFITLFLALAFKGIGENYLAGILLASRSPFTKGDLIKVGDYQGYVQNLNMRGTTIIDLNGNLILIPNIMVIQSVVENRSANPSMRIFFVVNIAYQESISRVQDLILNALKDVTGILEDPPPNVVVDELTSSGVRLKVMMWFDAKNHSELRTKSRAMIKIKDILLVNGISIPDDAREIIFADDLKVQLVPEAKTHQTTKKEEIKRAAAYNLEDTKHEVDTPDEPKEKLMDLAEKNPLPMNKDSSDLLNRQK